MPRLIDSTYLSQRELLKREWTHSDGHFARLSFADQHALHAYYLPSKNLSDQESLEHRRSVTIAQPSLPQRAGKSFAHFINALTAPQPKPVITPYRQRRRGPYQVRAAGLIRPDVDFDKIARVLLEVAQERGLLDERN